jgi:hypothetical protein
MKWRLTAAAWFSIFFENPLVRRVNRRIPIRVVRFWRSTKLVEIRSGSGQAGPRSTTVPPDSPDLPSWIGSGGVPGPELTRRFGFFTPSGAGVVQARWRPNKWRKKLVSTPESSDPLRSGQGVGGCSHDCSHGAELPRPRPNCSGRVSPGQRHVL